MIRKIAVTLLALASASGCTSDRPNTTAQRGVGPSDAPAATQPTPTPEQGEQEDRTAAPSQPPALPDPFALGPGDLTAEKPAEDTAEEPPADEPERDLGAELSEIVRRSGCLDLEKAAQQPGGRLHISVSAYVMGSGRITRATVNAPGQPAAALRCAEQQVVAAGLTGPVPNAPANVSGSTTIEVIAAAPPGQTPAPSAAPTQVSPPPVEAPAPPANVASPTSEYSLRGGLQPDPMAGAPSSGAPEMAGPP